MKKLTPDRFAEFYSAVDAAIAHSRRQRSLDLPVETKDSRPEGRDHEKKAKQPFPWQKRVAAKVCDEAKGWPEVIALPTASGKTTCIDIAVFALACGAAGAPRRIFFVVDRRVVVDQAYEHAKELAEVLKEAKDGILKEVAEALRALANDHGPEVDRRPLDVYALRGGMYREDVWVRSPSQPTIIASTVDQIGSRLLFRGYGVSPGMAPVHAGLVGNDSLILIDEAHCSKPFCETLEAVARYRSWNDNPKPFRFVTMTATPGKDVDPDHIERDDEEDRNHPVLGTRISASKPTTLVVAGTEPIKSRAKLVDELAAQARKLMAEGFSAVGCIVNRVATARELAKELGTPPDKKTKKEDLPVVVLLTGRMRPLDRDQILKQLEPLFSGKDGETKPMFVVATQCLEVGADLDFHGLVVECASLDALRQRFGRLNRVAARPTAKGAVVIHSKQTDDTEDDPVYGAALAETWKWLNDKATKVGDDTTFDFGVAAVREALEGEEDAERLNAPTVSAPIMLPAHVDCWTQTAPIPTPDPDVALFLHGPQKTGTPDVQVVFRSDLGADESKWKEIVGLMPPSSSEALPVRIDVFRKWLAEESTVDDSADVEGGKEWEAEELEEAGRKALCWRGLRDDETEPISSPDDVRPNRTYVVPVDAADIESLGDFPGGKVEDYAVQAFQRSRDRLAFRFVGSPLDPDAEDFPILLRGELEKLGEKAGTLLDPKARRVLRYPEGIPGFIVVGRNRLHQFDPTFDDESSAESATRREVSLDDHTAGVAIHAERLAGGLLPDEKDAFIVAARWHDIGKADPRFQAMLRNRSSRSIPKELLAKSAALPMTSRERDEARKVHGYPKGGRHELLSLAIAEQRTSDDLLLHLIASHHGECRPFAPAIVEGMEITASDRTILGEAFRVDPAGLDPAARNATVPDRFWRMVRQYGWWGLAYREAIFRLADQNASREEQGKEWKPLESQSVGVVASKSERKQNSLSELALPGLDGANPLAFLAALGILQLATKRMPGSKLSWKVNGTWTAILHTQKGISKDELIDLLLEESGMGRRCVNFSQDVKIPAGEFKDFEIEGVSLAAEDREYVDFLASFADPLVTIQGGPNAGKTKPTEFYFIAGQQRLLKQVQAIASETSREHLGKALFSQWLYDDPLDGLSLRWDPQDDFRYATRFVNPSKDKSKSKRGSMLGANRLAFEAISLFPCFVKGRRLATTGFVVINKRPYFVWPIWTHPWSVDTIRSALKLCRQYSRNEQKKGVCTANGIGFEAWYQSEKVPNSDYSNFAPSKAI